MGPSASKLPLDQEMLRAKLIKSLPFPAPSRVSINLFL
jgi:hypothetical protein